MIIDINNNNDDFQFMLEIKKKIRIFSKRKKLCVYALILSKRKQQKKR
jgi:hypothetical protein